MFARAVRAAGLPEPVVLPWARVAAGRVAVPDDAWVRVDSPGEDAEVAGLLAGAPVDPYRVEGSAAWYDGFLAALGRLRADVAAASGARLVNDPDEIAVMFDKRRCHAVLSAAGVPVPPALRPVTGYGELARADARGGPITGVRQTRARLVGVRRGRPRGAGRAGCGRSPPSSWPAAQLYNSLRVRALRGRGRGRRRSSTGCAPDGAARGALAARRRRSDGRGVDLRVVVVAGASHPRGGAGEPRRR